MKVSQTQRILDVLADGAWHSHHEFYGWCVLHSRISELRGRGHEIETSRDGDLYLYRLVSPAVETSPAVEAAPVLPSELEQAPQVIDGQLALAVT